MGIDRWQHRKHFERLVVEALEALPQPFLDRLANIDIEVRDWPGPEELRSAQVSAGATLLGRYVGLPLIVRTAYHVSLPDRIFIYQGPIERRCRGDQEIRELVGRVVRHEIAHHFGLSEAALHHTSVSSGR